MASDPKIIVVFLDEADADGRRLSFALKIAETFESHVVGLFVETMPEAFDTAAASLDFARGAGIDDAIRAYFVRQHAVADRLRESLEIGTRRHGITSEWRRISAFASIHEAMIHCFYADLAILPPHGRVIQKRPWSSADIVVNSGIPAFLVPDDVNAEFPRHSMIAWNASRVARRALGDALPHLRRSERVTVVVVDAGNDASSHGEEPGADVASYLGRQSIEAVVERVSTDGLDVGRALLRCADRLGADLIVAGTYGHPRMIELALGSTTRTLLGASARTFFISH